MSEGFADSLEEPPETLCENIMGEIRRERLKKTDSRRRSRSWRALLATAACFALIIVAAAATTPMLFRAGSAAPQTVEAVPRDRPAEAAGVSGGMAEEAGADSAMCSELPAGDEELPSDASRFVYAAGGAPVCYTLSDAELEEILTRLDGFEAEAPGDAPDESILAESPSISVYMLIYSERVIYYVDGGDIALEGRINAVELKEILAFVEN